MYLSENGTAGKVATDEIRAYNVVIKQKRAHTVCKTDVW
jgi:hypothetical protein